MSNGSGPRKKIVGGLIYDAARGVLIAVRAPSVVIAAGGLASLYFPNTDTMRGNTGDSYAVAARAGADLVDMEQVQFLPFCLASPPAYEGLCAGEPVMGQLSRCFARQERQDYPGQRLSADPRRMRVGDPARG